MQRRAERSAKKTTLGGGGVELRGGRFSVRMDEINAHRPTPARRSHHRIICKHFKCVKFYEMK